MIQDGRTCFPATYTALICLSSPVKIDIKAMTILIKVGSEIMRAESATVIVLNMCAFWNISRNTQETKQPQSRHIPLIYQTHTAKLPDTYH